jgi:hypothetical protein
MELNDDGMRFTWLERMYGRAKQSGPDPLQADPFSLAMHKGQVRPIRHAPSSRCIQMEFLKLKPLRRHPLAAVIVHGATREHWAINALAA